MIQRFATVTATNPIRIRMDGDTAPLPVSVLSLVSPRVGDRVSVRVEGTMRIVDGILGGPHDTGWQTPTLLANTTGETSHPPRVREVGGVQWWEGSIVTPSSWAAGWTAVAAVPEGLTVPAAASIIAPSVGSGGATAKLAIYHWDSSHIQLWTSTAGRHYIPLAPLTRRID